MRRRPPASRRRRMPIPPRVPTPRRAAKTLREPLAPSPTARLMFSIQQKARRRQRGAQHQKSRQGRQLLVRQPDSRFRLLRSPCLRRPILRRSASRRSRRAAHRCRFWRPMPAVRRRFRVYPLALHEHFPPARFQCRQSCRRATRGQARPRRPRHSRVTAQ